MSNIIILSVFALITILVICKISFCVKENYYRSKVTKQKIDEIFKIGCNDIMIVSLMLKVNSEWLKNFLKTNGYTTYKYDFGGEFFTNNITPNGI